VVVMPGSPLLGLCVIARWVIIVLFWAAPLVGHAACSLKPYDIGFPFSDAALEARDAFFASLCDESFAELVVDPDPRLKERFRSPSLDGPLENPGYPTKARRLNLRGPTVVAYVIETDGSVDHVIVIQSSGYRVLDDAEGVLRETTAGGSKVHELAYALDLDRPGAENVLLAVAVAEHPEGPRVRSFRIDRGMTFRRRRPAGATPPRSVLVVARESPE
jgi:hypothetical protein